MPEVTSVLITYHNRNRFDYQACAEFLRLAGVYVCENVICQEGVPADKESWQKYGFSLEYDIGDEECMVECASDSDGIRNRLESLKGALKEKYADSQLFACYDCIQEIYIKHDLMRSSVTLQYFKRNTEELDLPGDHFRDAARELLEPESDEGKYEDNRHFLYAQLYCLQKANLIRFLRKKPVLCYVNVLGNQVLKLAKQFPDFSNAWVLLGLVYEISTNYAREAINAFQRAVRKEGKMPYASSIYYWLGKRCEDYVTLKETSEQFYISAYKAMPKYRNIYKVARAYMGRKDWEKAVEFFQDSLQLLNEKAPFLDPLEQEYLFKVTVHISYLYLQMEDGRRAVLYARKAIEFQNEIAAKDLNNDHFKFYKKMYGEEAETYINLTLQRLSPRQAYQYLVRGYQKLNLPEEAEKYRIFASYH